MQTRIPCSLLAFIVCVCLFAAGTAEAERAASSPPRDLHHLATAATISESQRREISRFVEYWAAQLTSGEPRPMREASRKLREPLGLLGVSRVFRYEYAQVAIPLLDQLLDETDNHHVAVNLLQIARDVGMEPGLRMMVERSDQEREPRVGVRLWAARGFQAIVRSDLGDAGTRAMSRSVRDFAAAARVETEWHVLYRQFEALAAAPDSLSQQVDLLKTVAQRIEENDKANPKIQSVHRGVVVLREQFMELDPTAQRQLGEQAGRVLGRVLQIGAKHWDVAREDPEVSGWYLGAIVAAETLLMRIDAQVRSATVPDTQLERAWERGDRAAFQAQVQQWDRILRSAPYRD